MTTVSIHIITKTEPAEEIQFYRVPHDIERVNASDRPDGTKQDLRYTGRTDGKARQVVLNEGTQPEVYRLSPDLHTVLNCDFQWQWRNMNPGLSAKRWSTLMGGGLAWMNNTGSPPHYNCVTGEFKDSGTFPRFDANRVCGGAYLTGVEKDGLLYITSMRNNLPALPAELVLEMPYYWYYGTSVNKNGSVNVITRLGTDGNEHWVRVPLLTAIQCTLPLSQLHKWPLGKPLESPLWLP